MTDDKLSEDDDYISEVYLVETHDKHEEISKIFKNMILDLMPTIVRKIGEGLSDEARAGLAFMAPELVYVAAGELAVEAYGAPYMLKIMGHIIDETDPSITREWVKVWALDLGIIKPPAPLHPTKGRAGKRKRR